MWQMLRKTAQSRVHSVLSVKQREWKSATTLSLPGMYAAESQTFEPSAR